MHFFTCTQSIQNSFFYKVFVKGLVSNSLLQTISPFVLIGKQWYTLFEIMQAKLSCCRKVLHNMIFTLFRAQGYVMQFLFGLLRSCQERNILEHGVKKYKIIHLTPIQKRISSQFLIFLKPLKSENELQFQASHSVYTIPIYFLNVQR